MSLQALKLYSIQHYEAYWILFPFLESIVFKIHTEIEESVSNSITIKTTRKCWLQLYVSTPTDSGLSGKIPTIYSYSQIFIDFQILKIYVISLLDERSISSFLVE